MGGKDYGLLTVAIVLGGVAQIAGAKPLSCTEAALSTLSLPGVAIESVSEKPASAPNPAYCDVVGTVRTSGEGAPDGSAKFEIRLPTGWNGKFLFWGVGGLAGGLFPSANGVDVASALAKGYATSVTDTGHAAGGTDAAWALTADRKPDEAKLADYYFRGIHDATIAAKAIVAAYYDGRAIERAYFEGCSNGGREAMMEAMRFPDDYDGIIAGAPFMDIRAILGGATYFKSSLTPATYIPATLLPAIDKAVYESCDAVDGVKDGLIQNPGKCAFNPAALICKKAGDTDCLTQGQAGSLAAYVRAVRDTKGRLVFPGSSVTDLHGGGMDSWSAGMEPPADLAAAEPWGGTGFDKAPLAWQFVDHVLKFIVERDPGFDIRKFEIGKNSAVADAALARFDERTGAGNADVPARLSSFITKDKKLLIYHGFSDPALSPFRTIEFYEDLAAATSGGYDQLQKNVALFMVPGMQHCGGGPGPNRFDTLKALEAWVEGGAVPDGIVAAHHAGNDPRKPVERTMPLCRFPEAAKYKGAGDLNDAANWSCTSNKDMLDLGPNGVAAGLSRAN